MVPLVGLFGVLLVLYEFPSEQAGSFADLFVDLRSRNLPPDLTERPCPRLGMQVVGVHNVPSTSNTTTLATANLLVCYLPMP